MLHPVILGTIPYPLAQLGKLAKAATDKGLLREVWTPEANSNGHNTRYDDLDSVLSEVFVTGPQNSQYLWDDLWWQQKLAIHQPSGSDLYTKLNSLYEQYTTIRIEL